MKLYCKQVLLLGGIYGALSTLLTFIPSESVNWVSDILFYLFVFFNMMFCFNKPPKFIGLIQEKFPKTSYYLTAIGWVTYAAIVCLALFFVSGYFIDFSQGQIEKSMQYYRYGIFAAGFISLGIALWHAKRHPFIHNR